jgi:hypothetical protein
MVQTQLDLPVGETETKTPPPSSNEDAFENFVENTKSEQELSNARQAWFAKHKIVFLPETFKEKRLDLPTVIRQLISGNKPITNFLNSTSNILGTNYPKSQTTDNDEVNAENAEQTTTTQVPAQASETAAQADALPATDVREAGPFASNSIVTQNVNRISGPINPSNNHAKSSPTIRLNNFESLFESTNQVLSSHQSSLLDTAHSMFVQYLNNNNNMSPPISNYVSEMSVKFNRIFTNPPEVYEFVKRMVDSQLENNTVFDKYAEFFYDYLRHRPSNTTDQILNKNAQIQLNKTPAEKESDRNKINNEIIQEQVINPLKIQREAAAKEQAEDESEATSQTPFENSEDLVQKFRMFTFLFDQYKAHADNVEFIEANENKGQEITNQARNFIHQIGQSGLSKDTKTRLTNICFQMIEQVAKIHAAANSDEHKYEPIDLDTLPKVSNQPMQTVEMTPDPSKEEEAPPAPPANENEQNTPELEAPEAMDTNEPEKYDFNTVLDNMHQVFKKYVQVPAQYIGSEAGNLALSAGQTALNVGAAAAVGSVEVAKQLAHDLPIVGADFIKGVKYLGSFLPGIWNYLKDESSDYDKYVAQYLHTDLLRAGGPAALLALRLKEGENIKDKIPELFNDKSLSIVKNLFPSANMNMVAQFMQDKMKRITDSVDNYDYEKFIKTIHGVQNSKEGPKLTPLPLSNFNETSRPVDIVKFVHDQFEKAVDDAIAQKGPNQVSSPEARINYKNYFMNNIKHSEVEDYFNQEVVPLVKMETLAASASSGTAVSTTRVNDIANNLEKLILDTANNVHNRNSEELAYDWAFLQATISRLLVVPALGGLGAFLSRSPEIIKMLANRVSQYVQSPTTNPGVYRAYGRRYDVWHWINKKPHPINKVAAHINSLPKHNEQDLTLENHPGCEFCGSTTGLMGHDKNHEDLVCAKCLAAKGYSKKRYTSRNTQFYNIDDSKHEKHKRVAAGHKKNQLIFEMSNKNRPTLWEEFKMSANYDPKFLKQHSRDYVMNRKEWLGDEDLKKLTYLVGMYEHAPEKMNEHLLANMHGLAINHRINNKKAGSIKHLDPSKLLSFSTLKEHIGEHPETLSQLL